MVKQNRVSEVRELMKMSTGREREQAAFKVATSDACDGKEAF